ncbi:unnamed protein product [Closterium sp. Yama58-4]|nr:unnamed protein product [Closterium sp. Yama58-4]
MSISRTKISSVSFNEAGDWVAVGCARLGQLLVWEWRSETYVMKVQGHFYDVSCVAFSPDGTRVVTGSDDAKVKVWSLASGFCFVTLAEHTGPVTAVAFLPSGGAGSAAAAAAGGGGGGGAVVSASLDGTVRAFDLLRYRCFRTLTTPQPVQFASLAVHPSGEVVCAASQDDFQVYVWSMRTGRLLDVLSGHEGPVHSLAFSPTQVSRAGSQSVWGGVCGEPGRLPGVRVEHAHRATAGRRGMRGLFTASRSLPRR